MAHPWGAAVSNTSQCVWMAGLYNLLFAPSWVCNEDTVRDEGVGLLCMQTREIREGWQGHFGDKVRMQNDLDKLDEMAPNIKLKCKPGTTAKHGISAGGTGCSHQGWERMEPWLSSRKELG